MARSKEIEATIFSHGLLSIAGADEAGRGACAGPLVAAAVAIDQECIARLNSKMELSLGLDSKRFSESGREEAYEIIKENVLDCQVVSISPAEIDRYGLQRMNLSALRRAISQLQVSLDYVLTDGYPIDGLDVPSLAVWKGDAISIAVGAASIIAKVTRDRMMIELDGTFPGYGFATHKGYSSASHMAAIERLGITPVHRRSYANIARFIAP